MDSAQIVASLDRKRLGQKSSRCAMAKNTEPGAQIFPAEKRAQFLGPKPMIPDNWLRLRLYPIAKKLGLPFHPSFQVLRRSFSTHGQDRQPSYGYASPTW